MKHTDLQINDALINHIITNLVMSNSYKNDSESIS